MESVDWDHAVVAALGSNLGGERGSSLAILEAALARFPVHGLTVTSRSSWWRSASWPDPTAPDYLNGVAIVETSLDPLGTLVALRRIEAEFGRERGEANAPRTLDLDLIAHGRATMNSPALALPHPRAASRRFVMGPLAEIAPGWTDPLDGRRADALAAAATVGLDATPEPVPVGP